jgi:putative oxidoreductase
MLDLRTLIRPLLAAPFIVGGINALRAPQPTARMAADVAAPIGESLGLGRNPETLVKINAGVQIGAGIVMALGFLPRLTSVVLSASLVPTTIAGHRFWEEGDPAERDRQAIQFAKNAGVLGGLLATALDTGGRPSVFWSGRRAAERAAHNVADTVSGVYHTLPVVS